MPGLIDQATDLVVDRRYTQAEGLLKPYLARGKSDPAASYLLGHALVQLGRPEQGAFHLAKAASPDTAPISAVVEYGCVLFDLGRYNEGIAQLQRAVAQQPDNLAALGTYARMLIRGGLFMDALDIKWPALRAAPAAAEIFSIRAAALAGLSRTEEALDLYRKAAQAAPLDPRHQANFCFALTGSVADKTETFARHKAFGAMVAHAAISAAPPTFPSQHSGPLRIGFLSPDLRDHPVARFLLPLLTHLDSTRFQTHLFDCGHVHDAMTNRVKSAANRWHAVASLTEDALAALVREHNIDILIDLAGLTAETRIGVLARRAAPLQMTWLGYANTTGVPNIDYRIVNAITDPRGTEALNTEQLLRLPHAFLPLPDMQDAPPVSPRPPNAPFTFASFNNPTKITTGTLRLWQRVLNAVPGSVLALKGKGFADPRCRAEFEKRFAAAGLDLARLHLLPHASSQQAHLDAYANVDVALDTPHYNGTTTTCEALWMGVPVVTLSGRTHASRVGAALLHAAACPEWIAQHEDDYIRIAASLSSNPVALSTLRANLRERITGSPLGDAPAFASSFAEALTCAWQTSIAAR